MKTKRIITIHLFVLVAFQVCFAQENAQSIPDIKSYKAVYAAKHPGLAVQHKDATKLRLASFKTQYKLGEMIKVDLALLNASDQDVFLQDLLDARLFLKSKDTEKNAVPYIVIERAVTASRFSFVEPNDFISESFDLLNGCDNRAFDQINVAISEFDSRKAFDKDLFVSWGDFCLPVTETGTYYLGAEIKGDRVLFSDNNKSIKTVVGSIRSNLLEIKVTN